jgi:hypothetical protein
MRSACDSWRPVEFIDSKISWGVVMSPVQANIDDDQLREPTAHDREVGFKSGELLLEVREVVRDSFRPLWRCVAAAHDRLKGFLVSGTEPDCLPPIGRPKGEVEGQIGLALEIGEGSEGGA